MEKPYLKEKIKFSLDEVPCSIRASKGDGVYREVEMDLNSMNHAPIITLLGKEVEEDYFYTPDIIGVVSDIQVECIEVEITVAIHPVYESIWNNSKKKLVIEYIEKENKILVDSLYLEE